MKYILMAQGQVAHIAKPDSFVPYPGQSHGYYKTMCGRKITSQEFSGGITPLGDTLPDWLKLCSKCGETP